MGFYDKFELLEPLPGEGIKRFKGRVIATGSEMVAHLMVTGHTPENDALAGAVGGAVAGAEGAHYRDWRTRRHAVRDCAAGGRRDEPARVAFGAGRGGGRWACGRCRAAAAISPSTSTPRGPWRSPRTCWAGPGLPPRLLLRHPPPATSGRSSRTGRVHTDVSGPWKRGTAPGRGSCPAASRRTRTGRVHPAVSRTRQGGTAAAGRGRPGRIRAPVPDRRGRLHRHRYRSLRPRLRHHRRLAAGWTR